MKSYSVIQFTGSKVAHRPHPFNEGTLCGRRGGGEWTTGYHGAYGDVTCKGCIKAVPQATWSKETTPYLHLMGAFEFDVPVEDIESIRKMFKGDKAEIQWLPTQEPDSRGILAVYSPHYRRWYVYSN